MAAKTTQSVQSRIAQYLYTHPYATKAELGQALSISMPTIFSAVNEMFGANILESAGEMDSTGGRKATAIRLNPAYASSLGLSITRSTVQMVLIDLQGEILAQKKLSFSFSGSSVDLEKIANETKNFLKDISEYPPLLGCGIALPGIIQKEDKVLSRSHALNLENYSLTGFEHCFDMELLFENDANAALLAERPLANENLTFLYLGRTVGGTLVSQGKIVQGDDCRAGEFGHMILYPSGKLCYCGKRGCADAYCSLTALMKNQNVPLASFMEKAFSENTEEAGAWYEYLDSLALLSSNLRMAFDTEILIGGPLSEYIGHDLEKLREKTKPYDRFDKKADYLKTAKIKHAASAIGAAEQLFLKKIKHL